jgi:hypothetical protein
MLQHPLKALLTSIKGPKTVGDMIPEPTPQYVAEKPLSTLSGIPIRVEMAD